MSETSGSGSMTVGKGAGGSGGVDFIIPSAKNIEKATEEAQAVMPARNYVPDITNLADQVDAITPFESTSYGHYQRFIDQSARDEFETYLDNADAKYRMSQLKAQKYRAGSKQKQNSLSQLPSGQYYETCRLMTAAFNAIIFGDEQELPARFEPVQGSLDYTIEEGKRIAEGQNIDLKDVWEKNHWTDKIKESIGYLVKNAHEVLSMEWEYEVRTQTERVPGYYDVTGEPVEYKIGDPLPLEAFTSDGEPIPVGEDGFPEIIDTENGMPLSYVFVEKTRVIKENPQIFRQDLKGIFWDMDIDGFDNQTCVVFRSQRSLQNLLQKQKNGMYMNVQKLSSSQLYTDPSKDGSDLLEDMDDNANQNMDREANGLFDVYHIFMYAPITVKNGKAKWDKDAIPKMWEAVYAGEFGQPGSREAEDSKEKTSGSVCLMLRENPYNHGNFPYKLVVSHPDDRGSLHMGFYTLLEGNVEEQCITKNQLVDNKTLAIKAPFIAEKDNFLGRDAVFRDGNQLLWVENNQGGNALKKVEVPNVTNRTVEEMAMMKEEADSIVGTTDAFRGEFAGSRTTGTEYLGAKDQALKPILEHSKYISGQIFHFILPMFMSMSRQYTNPKKFIEVDGQKIFPAQLYGELDVKVVSIEKYEADLSARQVLINFIQAGGYALAAPFMGQEGGMEFWKTFFRFMKMPDAHKLLPARKPMVEAVNQVNADIRVIMTNPQKAMTDPELLPKPGEQHDLHIEKLTAHRELTAIDAKNREGEDKAQFDLILQAFDMYITIHEQLKAQEEAEAAISQQTAQEGSVSGQAQEVPGQAGEAAGDALAGVQGQIGQGI